jgi:hypothetical protein
MREDEQPLFLAPRECDCEPDQNNCSEREVEQERIEPSESEQYEGAGEGEKPSGREPRPDGRRFLRSAIFRRRRRMCSTQATGPNRRRIAKNAVAAGFIAWEPTSSLWRW